MGTNAEVEPPHELVVEGILEAEGPHRRVHTDACTKAVAAAGLATRPCRVAQHRLPAVQVCAVVKEERTLHQQARVLIRTCKPAAAKTPARVSLSQGAAIPQVKPWRVSREKEGGKISHRQGQRWANGVRQCQ